MSKVLEEVLAANARYVESFGDKGKWSCLRIYAAVK